MVFLTVGIVSFALGILNYFFAHDPRYAQDNKSVLKEHQHSMSLRGALAEMKRIVVIPSFAIIILQVRAQSISMCTGNCRLHMMHMQCMSRCGSNQAE